MHIFNGSVSRIYLQLCDAMGGTGLYLRAVTRGLFQRPPTDHTLRTMSAGFTLSARSIFYPRTFKLWPIVVYGYRPSTSVLSVTPNPGPSGTAIFPSLKVNGS